MHQLSKEIQFLLYNPYQMVQMYLNKADYRGTLLHEICHIGYEMYGLGDDDEMPQIGNEFLTTITSNMIQQLATLNKELFEFIFDSPK